MREGWSLLLAVAMITATAAAGVEVQLDRRMRQVRVSSLARSVVDAAGVVLVQDGKVVVDAQHCGSETLPCVLSLDPHRRARSVAVYVRNGARLSRVAHFDLTDDGDPLPLLDVRHPTTLPANTTAVGMFYSGWHAYAAQVVTQQAVPQPPITVEAVVRSNGNLTIEMMYQSNTSGAAAGFYYQSQPQIGFYCLYRKRKNETVGVLPDCPNIPATAKHHAALLVAAGVDYVTLDSTNLPNFSSFADAIQLRPAEVLCEEWYELRQAGESTPAVTIWAAIPQGANLYLDFLSGIYNHPKLSTLVARDPASGKMIFFAVENPTMPADPTIIAAIESNSGRNDIIVVKMWALFPKSAYGQGEWGFMSPCTDTGLYTTSVADLPACNQRLTTNSPIGSAMSASPSYQMNYGSVPFGAAGKLQTQTFRLQWGSVLANAGQIDHVFVSSFNEFIAQPQPNGFPGPYGVSMGLEWDPARTDLWVDSFGCDLARDIEPSVECGNATYDLLASCIRVLALRRGTTRSATTAEMEVDGESCTAASSVEFVNVWSLIRDDQLDNLITVSSVELNVLLSSGQWSEICNAYGGPTAFCVNQAVLTNARDATTGPFLLATTAQGGDASLGLYRCRTAGGTHFFTNQADCEGQTLDMFLGYSSPTRSTNFPRSLRRCYNPTTGVHYHRLDSACLPNDNSEALYGFVH